MDVHDNQKKTIPVAKYTTALTIGNLLLLLPTKRLNTTKINKLKAVSR